MAAFTFASPDFAFPKGRLELAARVGIHQGLKAAAVFDVEGKPRAVSGELDDDEVRAIGMILTEHMREDDRVVQMLGGQLLTSPLGAREITIGIAANCVFVVGVRDPLGRAIAIDQFRSYVEWTINDARERVTGLPPPIGGSGGSSSGPAELSVVEWGVTVPRRPRS